MVCVFKVSGASRTLVVILIIEGLILLDIHDHFNFNFLFEKPI